MQENKFKFKKDYYAVMREMTDKQAGEFTKGLCAYVFDGKPFITKDDYLKGVFMYVKRELDVSKVNSANGRKGGVISAENRQANRQKSVVGDAVLTGSFIADRAIETLLTCLKNVRNNDEGNEGKVSQNEEKGEAG